MATNRRRYTKSEDTGMVYTFTLIAWPGKVLAEKTLHADSIEEAISAFDPNDQTEDWIERTDGSGWDGVLSSGGNCFVHCQPER